VGKFQAGLGEELSLYVRQVAWMNAVPDNPTAKGRKPQGMQSRAEALRAQGAEVPLPPLREEAEHLVGYLFDVGPVLPAVLGVVPLPYSELQAWQQQSGLDLQPWEVKLLRQLSRDYAIEAKAASDAGRPAPWVAIKRSDAGDRVARQISLSMRARVLAQKAH
jgi:hypothetical protein